jgi:8-oxo-dGTP pyrophosphatase MutT (NUDIX family)
MATLFDPQALPVIGIDSHLPPVPAASLAPEQLRLRFEKPPVWSPELHGEKRWTDRGPALASVLVPLVQRDELTVLLTQRTEHLSAHAGQISFPGGRAEPEDADEVATALREAQEEIGLAPEHVDVLGILPTYTTGTGFIVTPVVGLLPPDQPLKADPNEVAEVFEVPLSFLMNPAHHRRHRVEIDGNRREFLSMPWPLQQTAPPHEQRHYFIWGATAAMLRNLYRFLSA